jgi:arylsulfatase A
MTIQPQAVAAYCGASILRPVRFAALMLGAASLIVSASAADAARPAGRPNLVFVLIDDFGYADSGPYGAKDIRTPHMDRLAREGVRFTDFYANAPVCTPTRCGFITGRWQQRVGFEWAMGFTAESFRRIDGQLVPERDVHGLGLPTSIPTLPKLLKAAGYATGAFGKWHLGYKDEYNPTKHGFDEYFGELLGHSDYYTHRYYDGTYALRDGLKPVEVEGYLTDLINRRAVEFVRKHAAEPFFLYVPHLAVHCPYQPPGRPTPSVTKENMYDGDRRTYAAMVEKVDEGLGMLLGELDRLGLTDDTLIVVSSDNGGERYSDNTPLFHHKSTLWEGGIRVPCLMRWPERLRAGTVTHQAAITMDLTATFAAAAGVRPDDARPFDGIDLLPILTGTDPERDRTFAWRIHRTARQQKAVRHGTWKYMQDGNVEMLFDLAADIGERRDLSFTRPDKFAELKQLLHEWEREVDREPTAFLVR